MRILVVADYYRHGTGRVIEDRATALVRRGHQVVLLAGADPDRIRDERHAASGMWMDPELVPWDPRDRSLRSLFRQSRAFRAAFERRISQRRFDAVLFNQPLSAWSVLRSPGSRGLVSLYTFHSPWAMEWAIGREIEVKNGRPVNGGLLASIEFAARRWLERRVLERSTGITLLSNFMSSQLATMHPGIAAQKITLIPGGVDLDRFRPVDPSAWRARKAAMGLPPDAPVLLTVRRLVPRMGLEILLRAFHRLKGEFPNLHLVMGGSGPLEGQLRSQARGLGLSSSTHFPGYIPEKALPGLYAAADLFILPTAQLEGFGLVTVESLASGTPVLGTPVGATPDILRQVDARLLAASANPNDLARGAAALLRLGQGPLRAIGARGRRVVTSLYDSEKVGERLDLLLKRMARPETPSRPRKPRRPREAVLSGS